FSSQDLLIKDLAIGQALVLPKYSIPIQTLLSRNSHGVAFQICSRPEETAEEESFPWLAHASGKIFQPPPSPVPKVDVDEIRASFRNEVSVAECYDQFREFRGLDYGASFRTIEQLWSGNGEAFGTVRLAQGLEADADQYVFHPVLLDGAI